MFNYLYELIEKLPPFERLVFGIILMTIGAYILLKQFKIID
jgi:hypothetical protein